MSIPVLVELKRGANAPLLVDPTFAPVPMGSTQVIRAFVLHADIEAIARRPEVVGVWSDPEIQPIVADGPPTRASGTSDDVAKRLRADELWAAANTRGAGVVIGIVDGGVDRGLFPVAGGWSPDPSSPPGSSDVAWLGHGNMCAHDALIACPDALIYDYSVGRAPGTGGAFLSGALQAFHAALTSHRANNTPQVLSNSWGVLLQGTEAPPGMAHPFMRKVADVMDEGILVSFAAGKSIRGASGHPRAVSVGAVNLLDEWIDHGTHGLVSLAADKPDVCGFGHFEGHTSCDRGASAACPVVAGVLGILAAAVPGITQDRAREALRMTARRDVTPWNANLGWGIVDAQAAFLLPP